MPEPVEESIKITKEDIEAAQQSVTPLKIDVPPADDIVADQIVIGGTSQHGDRPQTEEIDLSEIRNALQAAGDQGIVDEGNSRNEIVESEEVPQLMLAGFTWRETAVDTYADQLQESDAERIRRLKEKGRQALAAYKGRRFGNELQGNLKHTANLGLSYEIPEKAALAAVLFQQFDIGNEGKFSDVLAKAARNAVNEVQAVPANGIYNASEATWSPFERVPRNDRPNPREPGIGSGHALAERLRTELSQVPDDSRDQVIKTYILSALACGDPRGALGVIKELPEITGDNQAAERVLNDIVVKAQETLLQNYPRTARIRFDAVLAGIGTGELASLGGTDTGTDLQRQAEERLMEYTTGLFNRWYGDQQAVDVRNREVLITDESVSQVVREFIDSGQDVSQADAELKNRAEAVASGRAANILGRELIARIHPELLPEKLMGDEIAFNLGRRANGASVARLNDLEIFQSSNETPVNTLRQIPIAGNMEMIDVIWDSHRGVDFMDLANLLVNPDAYLAIVERAVHELEAMASDYPDDRRERHVQLVTNGRTKVINRLAEGIVFLNTIYQADESDEGHKLSRLLEQEFGITHKQVEDAQRALNDKAADVMQKKADASENQAKVEKDRDKAAELVKALTEDTSTLTEQVLLKGKSYAAIS